MYVASVCKFRMRPTSTPSVGVTVCTVCHVTDGRSFVGQHRTEPARVVMKGRPRPCASSACSGLKKKIA